MSRDRERALRLEKIVKVGDAVLCRTGVLGVARSRVLVNNTNRSGYFVRIRDLAIDPADIVRVVRDGKILFDHDKPVQEPLL